MLGVSVETLRRWEAAGRLRMERPDGGQRVVEVTEAVCVVKSTNVIVEIPSAREGRG